MIATSGDESFVMFAMFPARALLLNGILLIIAISSGWIVHFFSRKSGTGFHHEFIVHEQESCKCFSRKTIIPQFKAMSFERAVFLLITIVFTVLLILEITGPLSLNWKNITFLGGSFFLLFVFITVPDHFLKEHLYNHILKHHLVRIFLWTWGAFMILHYIQINSLISNAVLNHHIILLLVAVLVGIIPESGPNLIFVTLFSQNLIPFSILLANSIVQDGHGMLPLLAESRKDFIIVKIINVLIGLFIGVILYESGI